MKKLIVLVAVLVLASAAFAQTAGYVSKSYTGSDTARLTPDSKLGFHDVLATAGGNGQRLPDDPNNAGQTIGQDRNGCQSCHVPHEAVAINAAGEYEYLWRYALPTTINANGGQTGTITADAGSFHTLACLSCHDGVEASDVAANLPGGAFPSYAAFNGADALASSHPLNAMLTQRSTPPTLKYARLYIPAGYVLQVNGVNGYTGNTELGKVECGSCHDPHKGDAKTFDFLRGPSSTSTATDTAGNTYTGTSPQWARLGLCRDCHGK